MSDVQSNYPRTLGHGSYFVDIDGIKRAAIFGQIALLVFATAMTIFQILLDIPEFKNDPSGPLIMVGLGIIFAMILAGIVAIWSTMFWFTRTHSAVCGLRGITPRISSKVVGFFSGIPYLMLYIPLFYALEFLVVRSQSPDTSTMRWYTIFSKSKIVNIFGVFIVTDAALAAYGAVMEYVVRAPSILDSHMADYISLAIFWVAVILGIRIAKNVNRNIEDLVNRARTA